MRLVRDEEVRAGQSVKSKTSGADQTAPISQEAVFEARREIAAVHVSEAVEQYIADLIDATRHADGFGEPLSQWISVGSSPRATIALDKVSRAQAWLKGHDHVTPEDVQAIAPDVLRHRLILSYEAQAEGITPERVVEELLRQVAVV